MEDGRWAGADDLPEGVGEGQEAEGGEEGKAGDVQAEATAAESETQS